MAGLPGRGLNSVYSLRRLDCAETEGEAVQLELDVLGTGSPEAADADLLS